MEIEKLRAINDLASEAMAGHADLERRSLRLAGDNPVLLDDLRLFKDIAGRAAARIIGDAADSFRKI